MKRKAVTRAAEFASVAQKTGGVFVFASRDANFPHQENASAAIASHQFAKHRCRSCASTFDHVRAGNGYKPFCVTCGSEDVDVGDDSNPTIPADDELTAVVCSTCDTVHAFNKQLASMGHVHCASCGTSMKTTANADEDDLPATPNVLDMDDEETADDLEMMDIDEDEAAEVFDSTDDTEDHDELELPVQVSDADEMPGNNYTNKDTDTDGDTLEVNLVDVAVDEEMPVEELSFSYSGNRVNVLAGEKLIATLTAETAGSNADILQTDAFRMSVSHSVEKEGLKKALTHYNFKPVVISVALSKVVKAKVVAAVAIREKQIAAKQKDFGDSFQQALDIAAAGYASNFWRGKTDPVKESLIAELSAVGFRSPAKLINKVFAAHGVAQQRAVLEVARDLATKPVETLNSLSDAIDLARYAPVMAGRTQVRAEDESDEDDEDQDQDDQEDDEDQEEAQFEAVATPVIANAHHNGRSAATASPYRNPELRNILGAGSIFGNGV